MRSRQRLALITAAAAMAVPVFARGDDVSAQPILQMFEATWQTVERRAPDIFLAGYGGLWTPPPGRAEQGNLSVGYDVYDRFDLGSAGNQTLYGTETGLKTTVQEMHKSSVNVYSDLVWNHDGFADKDTTGFVQSGGYPGFHMTAGADTLGDFHDKNWTGNFYARTSNLIDIAQEKNLQYVRNPVPGFAANLPAGTASSYYGGARVANVATESNRRFYPDLQGASVTVNGVTYFKWNSADPSTGDPVSENATGYLMRQARWMVDVIGVDGFRLDATKHVINLSDGNPDWVLEYYDQAVNAGTATPYLNGTRKPVFGFGEYYDGNVGVVQNSIKKNANANRDALDFAMYFALKSNLSSTAANNNWVNVVNTTQDTGDDGLANNGSQGVAFVQAHDDGLPPPDLSNVAYAYTLMRPGNSIVYMNAKEFGSNRSFPRDGRGDALGGLYGNTITKLVGIRNAYGRGNYSERSIDQHTLVFERLKSVVAAYNNDLANGYDTRTVQTSFDAGTHLIELTGNSNDALVDPNSDLYDAVTVNGSGQITIRIPRNKNANGVEHGKGYVMYGPATPRGTLAFTNVARTIAGETPTAATNGTARLASIDVIKTNSFEVQLQTDTFNLPDGFHDEHAEGDAAVLRFDGGLNINGNAGVDVVDPSNVSYGFESFLTEASPRFGGGSGLFRQTIDATTLSEGFHYVTARAYRHRNVGTGGDGGPAVFTDFRKVIYVDRERPTSSLDALLPINGSADDRDVIVKSLDKTATGVAVFYNLGPNQLTLDQLADQGDNIQSLVGSYDRDLFKYSINNWKNGNNVLTVVTYETSYDPTQLYAGGGVTIQRYVGIGFTTGAGQGLADTDFNNSISSNDVTQFYNTLRTFGGTFNPAADLNADGNVDDSDSVLLHPWLVDRLGVTSTSVLNAANGQRLARALETDGTLEVIGGTLNIFGYSVNGVPITFNTGFNITANKTVNKTGTQTLNVNGTQNHGANAALITSVGTTNLNTDGNTNLAVTSTGAGSAVNFAVTQHLRALTVASGGTATLSTASANNVNGGKAIHTPSVTALTGKLDLKNNNLAVNYTGTSALGSWNGSAYTGILAMLAAGRGAGVWNGTTGITSSSASAMALQTALAAAEASDVLGLSGSQTATWYGGTVDATSVLVKYTWGGDANLNGVIDADDYFQIDFNYNKTPGGFYKGDFNYSGGIDGDDYFIIDSNYAAQLGPMSAPPALLEGAQAVPEPAMGLLLAPALMALRRRRRGSMQRD